MTVAQELVPVPTRVGTTSKESINNKELILAQVTFYITGLQRAQEDVMFYRVKL